MAALMALSACNMDAAQGQDEGESAAALGDSQSEGAAGRAAKDATATLGPIAFHYDPARLTLTEVELPVPPDYAAQTWALKLIPADRAARLGEKVCSYGESGLTQTCRPEQEPGLALALLERPLTDYRQAFAGGLAGELEPDHLDGADGFQVAIGAEGSGTRYRFIPVDGRTLLIARQFAQSQGEQVAMADVLGSIAQGIEP